MQYNSFKTYEYGNVEAKKRETCTVAASDNARTTLTTLIKLMKKMKTPTLASIPSDDEGVHNSAKTGVQANVLEQDELRND